MRILGIDLGEVRVGLALSDEMGWTAQPFEVIKRQNDAQVLDEIARIVTEQEVGELVVGMPFNMNGSEGPRALLARTFIEELTERLHLPVHPVDERLSTVFAERALLEADMRRDKRKRVIDKVAAAVILQGYLDSRSR